MLRKTMAAMTAASLLAGCGPTVQMTSGTDYLARYSEAATAPEGSTAAVAGVPRSDALVRKAAAVDPDLRLPGRFGLARIVNGRLTPIPPGEAALWQQLAQRQRPFGEFVAISPLVATFTTYAVDERAHWKRASHPGEVVQMIRLGAARQHVDAVLIYEVGARASREFTWLTLADLTLIGGAILPTRSVSAEGRAEALLLDVRNGYPYGTAAATADLSTMRPSWGSGRRTEEMQQEAVLEVVENLVPEVETMVIDLAEKIMKRKAPGTS